MILEDFSLCSVTKMKADFLSTVTRRQGCLTFAMKKRPTSGDVTFIRTSHVDVDVNASNFKDMMVLVVSIIFPFTLYKHILNNTEV